MYVYFIHFKLLYFSNVQIVGRGNDQVAMTSKFETREDFGKLFLCFCLYYSFYLPVQLKENLFI